MPQSFNQTSPKSIADVFIDLEAHGVSRKVLAAAAGVSVQFIGVCVSGNREPSYETMRLLMQRGGPVVASIVAEHFCEHSPVQTTLKLIADEKSLDVNGDGRVDAGDVVLHVLNEIGKASSAMKSVCEQIEDGKLTEGVKTNARRTLNEARGDIDKAIATIDFEQPFMRRVD